MVKAAVETAILKNEQTGVLTSVNPDWFELLGWEEQLGTDVYIWGGDDGSVLTLPLELFYSLIIFRFIYFTICICI